MGKLFDQEFLNRIQRLTLSMGITVSGNMSGNRKSKNKGISVEFSDFREYTEGDDFRRIDWNAYGRFEKLFIKLFMEEKEAPVNIFLDTSKSMDWGEPNKSYASRRLAAAFSIMALSNYDRLSLYCISNRAKESALALRGTHAFSRVLKMLENTEYGGLTNINAAVRDSLKKANRGITIIISDFLSEESVKETIKYLKYLKQDVYIFHTLAPQEIEPPINSGCRIVDSETGKYKDLIVTNDLIKAYRQTFLSFTKGIESDCVSLGASYVFFDSSWKMEQVIKKVVGV